MAHQVDFSAFQEKTKPGTEVKQVIGVASGKGGVGKSMVTALLAVAAAKKGLRTAILDADITGPSIPGMFGLEGRPEVAEDGGLLPLVSAGGIRVMSMNFLLDRVQDSVIWRGPMIAGVVKQFWTEVHWGEIDVMFVDMPPGTGDVPLTVYQSIPVKSTVMVTTPQTLVRGIVEKAVDMTKKMLVPLSGLVENMAYYTCPDCGKRHDLFGPARGRELAGQYGIPAYLALGMDPGLTGLADSGRIEEADDSAVMPFLEQIMN